MKSFVLSKPPDFFVKQSETEKLYQAIGNLVPDGDWIFFHSLTPEEVDRIRGLVIGGGKNSRMFKSILRQINNKGWKVASRTENLTNDGKRNLWIGVISNGNKI